MKRFVLIVSLILLSSSIAAQDLMDGFRMSRTDLAGTARFVSMSGAFGALGGDLSALEVNPAGSTIFLNNSGAFSFDLGYNRVETGFGDIERGFDSSRRTTFDIPQGGAVFVFNNNDKSSAVNKLSFGMNYQRTLNHESRLSAFGRTNESIGDYFIGRAQGFTEGDLQAGSGQSLTNRYLELGRTLGFGAQEAYLAYESFLIDPTSNGNWQSNALAGANGFYNDMLIREQGFNGKLMFNFGMELMEKLSLGMNVNMHFMNYRRGTDYLEINNGNGEIQEINYFNELRTNGGGFSLQFGAIYKATSNLRLGLAYHSPTWFRLEDELEQFLTTDSDALGFSSAAPNAILFFPGYRFQTPSKTTLSAAYIFGQNGLLSLDYTREDFSNQRFRSSGFGEVNEMFRNVFQATNSLNFGGEWRLGMTSLRAGYHYSESPFADNFVFGDTNGYSLGIGFNFGNSALDFAFRRTFIDRNDEFVQTGIQQRAFVENTLTNFFLTYSFGF